MARPVVVVTDAPFPDFRSAEAVLAGIDAEIRHLEDSSPASIGAAGSKADAVMVTYAKITGDALARFSTCRIVARMGIGLDNIDLAAATRQGILVTNVPDYCIDEVSDHALALILALARKIPQGNDLVRAGGWNVAELAPIHRLRGHTLGLVGFGKIARALAGKAQALGLEVVAHDPYVRGEDLAQIAVRPVDFDELLAVSDIVSIHVPLTDETHHLFGTGAFARMKKGAVVINTARGPLVDEEALAEAVGDGWLSGAGLDVLTTEPPAHDSRLLQLPSVILTPHTGYYSEESTAELQRKAAEEVVRALTGQHPRYPANPDVLSTSV